jgi:signal transduction histidine kinase/ActR/RegA family two-component response regulator
MHGQVDGDGDDGAALRADRQPQGRRAPSEPSPVAGESLASAAAILDSLDLPVIIVGPSGDLTRFNRAASSALDLTSMDIGRPVGHVPALEDVQDIGKLCEQAMADGASFRRDVRRGDRWFVLRIAPCDDSTHDAAGAVLTFTNVTAFRASIEQAIYEREYTKAILNAVSSALVVVDAAARVQTANRAFYDLFGVSREASQGVPLEELSDRAWKASPLWDRLAAVVRDDSTFEILELEGEFPMGRRVVLIDARKLPLDGDASILLAFHDVTERNRTDEALRRSRADLEDAHRRKDEFLAMLAHELRNPLAPIRSSLDVLRMAGDDMGLHRRAHVTMDRQMSQLERLVDDLLDISRISRDKLELRRQRVDLVPLLRHAVEASRPMMDRAGHAVTVSLPSEALPLDADPVRLAQLFGNLLSNACKFTEPRGRISLTCERHGTEAVVSCKDDGMGIPPSMLTLVFELFTQVDRSMERSQGGLGIGLTLVKRLVELHGGRVQAFSNGTGLGSEFVVRLPLAADQPVSEVRASVEEHKSPTPVRKVLVVDDNRDAAESLTMLLELVGHQPRSLHDGLAAVEAVEEFQPDVVLLDLGLPGLNGYETARRIRGNPWGASVVIVAVTGWGQEEDRRRSREAGFDAHLLKPIDLRALEDLLASLPRSVTR